MKKLVLCLLSSAPFLINTALIQASPKPPAIKATPTPAPTSVEGLKKQIAGRKGKVVLVNFWATWCTPCVAELPTIAKLQKDNSKKLAVVFVSADETSDRAKAGELLKKKGYSGASWIIAGSQESFLKKFDPKAKELSLPRTYLYGRDGKLIKAISAEEAKNLEVTVKKLLK